MNGTIVLNNSAGRALRRGAADVFARDVRDCIGDFDVGDPVYITFRAVDGGQYAVATAVSCRSAAELRRMLPSADDAAVVREIQLLW